MRYISISDFVRGLKTLGEFLNWVSGSEGCVAAVIPNIGLTKASVVLGMSFQGVKGFAAVVRRGVSLPL